MSNRIHCRRCGDPFQTVEAFDAHDCPGAAPMGQQCPTCHGPIAGILTRGPSEHVIHPCGHLVGPLTVRELVNTEVEA